MSRRAALARGILLCAALAACGSDAPEAGPLSEVYVSAVNVSPRSWRPLSQGTLPPEKLPGMVMYEVSVWPTDRPATPEQQAAAADLVARSRAAAVQRGWFDFARAERDGFQPIADDPTHFANTQYLFDDALLDPLRPEVLMYAKTNQGRKLAGFMYYVREPGEHGLQIGGPLTLWHYHVWPQGSCLLRGMIPVGRPDADAKCSFGEFQHKSPEMLHVWLIDHPEGPFATNMSLPRPLLKQLLRAEEVDALGHDHAEHGDAHAGHAGHEGSGASGAAEGAADHGGHGG